MKNGDTKVEELTAMVDAKIISLQQELAKWRERRIYIISTQEELGILTENRKPPGPKPPSEAIKTPPEQASKYADLGLTDAVKAVLRNRSDAMFTPPGVRDELRDGGFDVTGMNFHVMLGQTLKRLARNSAIVETSERDGKKHFSAGKELL